jgi:hypothetical protein
MLIKTKKYWVSDTSSDLKNNKVYQVEGFKHLFKEKYREAEEGFFVVNDKKELILVKSYDEDLKVFDTQEKAILHKNKREKYWLEWYQEKAKEYQEKVDEYLNKSTGVI